MKKAIFISGYLNGLSDNIIPFLNADTDVFVHTWIGNDNKRWVNKLNRYKKFCKDIKIVEEEVKFERKRISYLYSTYSAVNLCTDIESYEMCIKFKPNLDILNIDYNIDTNFCFTKAKLQSRPLLDSYTIEDCAFGTIHYKSIDERFFVTYPKALKKVFKKAIKTLYKEITDTHNLLSSMLGSNYEGSLLWTKLFEQNEVPLIQDINLTLPNNIQWQ